MRLNSATSIILAVIFQLLFAITGKGQSIDTAKVTLGLKNESLSTAIKKIEQQSSFRFFYRDADIRPFSHLNLVPGTRTVKQTLEFLLQNTSLSFRQIEGNILLKRKGRQASYEIKGRVLKGLDKEPMSNASVFLSNTTIGNKTAGDGAFTLREVKPGKYILVTSIVGFETYSQTITVSDANITLPDIEPFPATIVLDEVSIHPKTTANWERNYNWFKDEFLGRSEIAKECKILNPDVLDLDYDETKSSLTASSSDFLDIENEALGYKIKYLLTNFTLVNRLSANYYLDYRGAVFFEEMIGTPAQEKHWQKRRYQVYEGSIMHFLRSAINNRIDEEGFRIQQFSIYSNPDRPSDSLINAKIKKFKLLNNARPDSLALWVKKSKLPKTFQTLMPFTLNEQDIIKTTKQPGQYSFGCENDGLYIAYSKTHHYHINYQLKYLDNSGNTENTLINFNAPCAFFNSSGVISNPNSLLFYGACAKKRVAELLPADYETPESEGRLLFFLR
ncbi:MAG: hypothetical protein JWQ63_3377 [Mucilaginibacter sp.]|nr:hypothetical protein [Mucilaginibacter sp.]